MSDDDTGGGGAYAKVILGNSHASRALALRESLPAIGWSRGHREIETTVRYRYFGRHSVHAAAARVGPRWDPRSYSEASSPGFIGVVCKHEQEENGSETPNCARRLAFGVIPARYVLSRINGTFRPSPFRYRQGVHLGNVRKYQKIANLHGVFAGP